MIIYKTECMTLISAKNNKSLEEVGICDGDSLTISFNLI